MTWTDEEREEAADACALLASSDELHLPGAPGMDLCDAIDRGTGSYTLASASWDASYDSRAWWRIRERWAEAEARLRCGWTPGDEP